MELVDVLVPPTFEKSGVVKTRRQANLDGDWRGSINVWVLQSEPKPAFLLQLRHPSSTWEPNKLDVTAGGAYSAGETLADAPREAEEEIGKRYRLEDMMHLGRRLNISPNIHGVFSRTVTDVCLIVDDSPLESFTPQESELSGLYICPLDQLAKLYRNPGYSFIAQGITAQKQPATLTVDLSSFPYNWDNYFYKMLLLAQRHLAGEKNLIY